MVNCLQREKRLFAYGLAKKTSKKAIKWVFY